MEFHYLKPSAEFDRSNVLMSSADTSLQHIYDAHEFHTQFLKTAIVSEAGICGLPKPDWAAKMLRRMSVPEAVVEKLGSTSFCKRRPQDTARFLEYVSARNDVKEAITFRIPVGPLKNMNRCGEEQAPDLAEYLTLIQLARMVSALATLYPHGIKVQLVPDDLRARKANMCPERYTSAYIESLQHMVKALSFDSWMQVEQGEAALYKKYDVESFQDEAEQKILDWKDSDPDAFNTRWLIALDSAEKNFPAHRVSEKRDEIAQSAWRYLVAHQAEILSGMWSTQDAFPLVMANHNGNFQIFTLGTGKTKLPWQIALPNDLIQGTSLEDSLAPIFKAKPRRQPDMRTLYAIGMLATP